MDKSYYPHDEFMLSQQQAYVRILHAVPGGPEVDVYANNTRIGSNLTYKNFSKYIAIPPGEYNIRIYRAGRTDNPLLQQNTTVPPQSIYTVATVGRMPNIELVSIPEPRQPIPEGMTYLRFANLAPNAPNVDVRLPDGAILFNNIGYKEMSYYTEVPPGRYTFTVYPTGTDTRILYVPNIQLKPDKFYTIYAVGLTDSTQTPLQLLFPLDGNSYL